MDSPYDGDYVIMGKDFVDTTDENKISKFEIPKHIVFTYIDLKFLPNKVFYNWKNLNPEYKLIFFDDEACEYLLNKKFETNYGEHFRKILHPPFKADFFRICFLYIYGGVYSDIDIEPYKPIDKFYNPFKDVKFMTALGHSNSTCFQAIIISTRNNIILKNNIKHYIEKLESFKNLKMDKGVSGIGGTKIMYDKIYETLLSNSAIKNWEYLIPHKRYKFEEKIDNIKLLNVVVLLDEFSADGMWWNCEVRNGYEVILKSKYKDYPWFKQTWDKTIEYNLNKLNIN